MPLPDYKWNTIPNNTANSAVILKVWELLFFSVQQARSKFSNFQSAKLIFHFSDYQGLEEGSWFSLNRAGDFPWTGQGIFPGLAGQWEPCRSREQRPLPMLPRVAISKASIRRQGLQPPQTQAAKGHSKHITLTTDGASHTSHQLSVTAMISGNGTRQLL